MKKILIFGIGKQGKKYISWFKKKSYIVDIVSKNNRGDYLHVNKAYLFNENINFNIYSIIVVAVAPIDEQEKVIKILLSNNITCKVIIEKPIARSTELIERLANLSNYYFFIDEVGLSQSFKSNNIHDINIFARSYDIFDHAIGLFLTLENFSKVKLSLSFTEKFDIGLHYKIFLNNASILIECNHGIISVNGKENINVNLENSIKYYINMDSSENQTIKKNFIKYLKQYS